MASSQSSTPLSVLSFSLSPSLSSIDPPDEVVYAYQQWVRIEHPPSKRRGVSQFKICEHGSDYVNVVTPNVHA